MIKAAKLILVICAISIIAFYAKIKYYNNLAQKDLRVAVELSEALRKELYGLVSSGKYDEIQVYAFIMNETNKNKHGDVVVQEVKVEQLGPNCKSIDYVNILRKEGLLTKKWLQNPFFDDKGNVDENRTRMGVHALANATEYSIKCMKDMEWLNLSEEFVRIVPKTKFWEFWKDEPPTVRLIF